MNASMDAEKHESMESIDSIDRALANVRALAQEISLEDILLELRRFYRGELHEEVADPCPPYRQVCEGALRALDRALWRLESDEGAGA